MDPQQTALSQAQIPVERPLSITFLAWLYIATGILGIILAIFYLGFSLMVFAGFGTPGSTLLAIAFMALLPIVRIVTGVGLLIMRKWSIYLTILVLVSSVWRLASDVAQGMFDPGIFIEPLVLSIITLHIWEKRSLFS